MSVIKEFRDFALKGNIMDLAIAVIIGAAFGAIVSSLVEDVITPLLLTPLLKAANAENIEQLSRNGVKYGKFIAAVIKFILIAIVLFTIIKSVNKFNRKKEQLPVAPPPPSSTDALLMQIRDYSALIFAVPNAWVNSYFKSQAAQAAQRSQAA